MNFEGLDLPTLIAIAGVFITYAMPWCIAALRDHHRQYMIGLLNMLLGWTVIGWVVAFLWAAGTKSGHEQEEQVEPER
ncbi:MAG: superinfection immunity protein, partial [Nitrococcus sp.]|nr:superinfection immunity protein [Nitrococcus sp.]